MRKYIAKKDTWFDAGTEAELIGEVWNECALFSGIHNGEKDEELCQLEEFNIIDVEVE